MSVLIDTSVLIDHLRGLRAASRYLDRLRRGPGVTASILTRAEIRAGTLGSSPAVDGLLQEIAWHPVTDVVADRAGSYAREYAARFPGVGLVDYLIAATADVLGYRLATRNVKHFPMFVGLRAPY